LGEIGAENFPLRNKRQRHEGQDEMNVEGAEKKLREARFFLGKMGEHERMAFTDKEPYDFYLSAFLSAARTVDLRLRHEQRSIYPAWRNSWDANNQTQQGLIKFMVAERNIEVHQSGSSRVVKTENRELGLGTHTFACGTFEVFGPPWVRPLATIQTPTYNFTIDGTERKATEACGEYLALLERMVATFVADHP
jgi:hypothetical protein